MTEANALDATLRTCTPVGGAARFFTVTLDRPLEAGEGGVAFEPGQYVTVGVLGPDGQLVRRPLTLTSPPSRTDEVELLLNRVETPASAHPLSWLLFDLEIGARLAVRPVATGNFTLPRTVGPAPERVLFVASGTGIAPFLSMIRDRAEREAPLDGWALLQIATSEAEVIAKEELSSYAGLRHEVFVGDPEPLFEDPEPLEARLGVSLEPERTPVLGCGLGADLRKLTFGLLRRGYVPPHRRLRKALGVPLDAPTALFLEQYDAERLFDTKDEALMPDLKGRLPPPSAG